MRSISSSRSLTRGLILLTIITIATVPAFGQVSGAVFTTSSSCAQVNGNIYADKSAVYINGGPAKLGAAGLDDGYYYVRVTTPSGDLLLGTSGNETPVHVTNGSFDTCYQLWSILIRGSDGTPGYDTTTNPGGEYKVWVSTVSSFDNSSTKTDNFKLKNSCDPGVEECDGGHLFQITGYKFYDANGNGTFDGSEVGLPGWQITLSRDITECVLTEGGSAPALGSYGFVVAPDTEVTVAEGALPTGWHNTTPTSVGPFNVDVNNFTGPNFGNVCLGGSGGGLTLGFWSNKNGQRIITNSVFNAPCSSGTADVFQYLSGLNLRNADGSEFNPVDYAAFRPWLLSATATNMAYMLSAQLSAMELNVGFGKAAGSSLIYAPGTTSANSFGFATVCDIITEANTSLGLHGSTVGASTDRTYQETLKNALDQANNNINFIQQNPALCPAYAFSCGL